MRKVLVILALLVGACMPPHVVGIDIATPAQLAARPYHVITVIDTQIAPARGGMEGAVERLKARAKELGGDAIMEIGEGAAGAVAGGSSTSSGSTTFHSGGIGLIRKLHATVIAWEK